MARINVGQKVIYDNRYPYDMSGRIFVVLCIDSCQGVYLIETKYAPEVLPDYKSIRSMSNKAQAFFRQNPYATLTSSKHPARKENCLWYFYVKYVSIHYINDISVI